MEKIKFIREKNFEELPKTSGVYFFFTSPQPNGEGRYSKSEIIYIGKAVNLKNRVKNHFSQPSYRDNLFVGRIDRIGFVETNSEIEALILEANLIKKYQPKFNVVWRDDKNYFYVAIEKNRHKIPYVYITHQPRASLRGAAASKQSSLPYSARNNSVHFIGPFVEGQSLKKTLKLLRRAFPFYTSKNHAQRKCTWCHLELCPGPDPDLKLYKKNLKKLSMILQGKSQTVLKSLKKEMTSFSKDKRFEEAGKIRDKIFALQQVMAHTNVISTNQENSRATSDVARTYCWGSTQKILQGITNQPKEIHRIECYDISNTQGNQATGSMVVFSAKGGPASGWAPDKSQYKKFKIKMDGRPNDIAMLKETISRRLAHPEWKYPEIMLIDGGIAQLNVAIRAKDLNLKTRLIKVISIAKGKQELWIEGKREPIPLKNLPQEIYNLVKQLDDEAHRFAITYHKKLRKQNLLK